MNFERFVGLPYTDGGRDYDGVDCWGLLYLFYRDALGISVPTYSGHYERPLRRKLAGLIDQEVARDWQRRSSGAEQPGDGVIIQSAAHLCHVGILAPGGRILHCEDPIGSVLERRDASTLSRRVEGFYVYDPCPSPP